MNLTARLLILTGCCIASACSSDIYRPEKEIASSEIHIERVADYSYRIRIRLDDTQFHEAVGSCFLETVKRVCNDSAGLNVTIYNYSSGFYLTVGGDEDGQMGVSGHGDVFCHDKAKPGINKLLSLKLNCHSL